MENTNENMSNNNIENRSGKVWAGIFIIGVGAVLLLNNVGLDLPRWLFSWSTLLIVIGLFIGFKHRFKHNAWIVLVLIGSYFTLERALDVDFDFGRVTLPIVLVTVGLFLIFKPKSDHAERWKKRRNDRWNKKFGAQEEDQSDLDAEPLTKKRDKKNSHDYLDSVNIFGGSHQTIYSKNFQGGEIVAVFGGCDLNLTQADFEGDIIIDITAVFGGCKIILPPGWQVKSEITAIFGGLDDKRSVQPMIEGQHKLVTLRGVAMFGGVDIRNF